MVPVETFPSPSKYHVKNKYIQFNGGSSWQLSTANRIAEAQIFRRSLRIIKKKFDEKNDQRTSVQIDIRHLFICQKNLAITKEALDARYHLSIQNSTSHRGFLNFIDVVPSKSFESPLPPLVKDSSNQMFPHPHKYYIKCAYTELYSNSSYWHLLSPGHISNAVKFRDHIRKIAKIFNDSKAPQGAFTQAEIASYFIPQKELSILKKSLDRRYGIFVQNAKTNSLGFLTSLIMAHSSAAESSNLLINRLISPDHSSFLDSLVSRFQNDEKKFAIELLEPQLNAFLEDFSPIFEIIRDHGSLIESQLENLKERLTLFSYRCLVLAMPYLTIWNFYNSSQTNTQSLKTTLYNCLRVIKKNHTSLDFKSCILELNLTYNKFFSRCMTPNNTIILKFYFDRAQSRLPNISPNHKMLSESGGNKNS